LQKAIPSDCAGDRLYVLSQAADVVARTDGDGGDALVGGQLDGEPVAACAAG